VRRLNHIDNHCRQLPRWPWGHTDVRCDIEATLANTRQLPRKAQEALLLHLNIWNTHWPRGRTIYPSRRIIPDAKRERDASKEKKNNVHKRIERPGADEGEGVVCCTCKQLNIRSIFYFFAFDHVHSHGCATL
jgi:hypothetical protein